jgi:hypothetical protein
MRFMRGILRYNGEYHLARIQIRQSLRSRDQLTLWWKDGRNPDQILGRDSGIAQRQLERRQALFVFTDPLGKENPLGDHVFGQFRNPPGF